MAKTDPYIMCPYCFEKIPYDEIEYFCDCERKKFRLQAERELEPIKQGEFYQKANEAEDWVCKIKDLSYDNKKMHNDNDSIICEKCNHKVLNASNRRCSHEGCTRYILDQSSRKVAVPLPKVLFEKNIGKLPFAIIGTSQSGKSVYMHMMLNELKNNNKNLNLSLEAKGFGTLDTHQGNYKRMKDQHLGLERTPKGYQSVKSSMWLLINNLNKNPRTNAHFFNIFDGAGEAHQDIATGRFDGLDEKEKAYVLESKTIIFVVDPLTFTEIREDLLDINDYGSSIGVDSGTQSAGDNSVPQVAEFNPVDIITAVAQEIRNNLNNQITKSKKKIGDNDPIKDIPVAVVFTKMDLFWDSSYQLKNNPRENNAPFALTQSVRPSPHAELSYFNKADCDKVHDELYKFFKKYGGNFMTDLERCFKNYKLFAVSSLGGKPDKTGVVPVKLYPHRVLDPILWLLSEKGIITGRR